MAHTKNYLAFFCLIFFFISCNQHNEEEPENDAASIMEAAPVVVNYNEAVNTTVFNDAYSSSITQTFIAKQKKITVLTGKRGLKVTINPAALETEDGLPVDGDIKVHMIELTTSEDLFKSNAATMSNGKLLASGGSYFVGMECNGKKLQLKNHRTIKMEFPRLKDENMELFYGERDGQGNMNWEKANEPLEFNTVDNSIAKQAVYKPPFPDNEQRKKFTSRFKLYRKISDTVYYKDKQTSLEGLVHTLQQNGVDKNIDTLKIPVHEFYYGFRYKPQHKYDTIRRYRIVSCKDIEDENTLKQEQKKITDERDEANRIYNEEWWKQNDDGSLETKLQRYYAPSSVQRLGWINCDRFYQSPQQIETAVELPVTYTNVDVQYFLIFKSFNGLMSGKLMKSEAQGLMIPNLPRGERVTIVAFYKQKGQVYNCKEDFIITAGKIIKPSFKEISTEEMTKIFGSNILM